MSSGTRSNKLATLADCSVRQKLNRVSSVQFSSVMSLCRRLCRHNVRIPLQPVSARHVYTATGTCSVKSRPIVWPAARSLSHSSRDASPLRQSSSGRRKN